MLSILSWKSLIFGLFLLDHVVCCQETFIVPMAVNSNPHIPLKFVGGFYAGRATQDDIAAWTSDFPMNETVSKTATLAGNITLSVNITVISVSDNHTHLEVKSPIGQAEYIGTLYGNTFVNSFSLMKSDVPGSVSFYTGICTAKILSFLKTTISYVYENGYNLLRAVGDTSSLASLIASAIKGGSTQNCGGDVVYWWTYNDGQWAVAWSTWTTGSNCKTTASTDDIRNAFEQIVDHELSHDKIGICVHLNHGGTWDSDIRILQLGIPGFTTNAWDMQCPTSSNSNFAYVNDCFS
ncbi:hypothetical protein TPHA_0K02350 [Tetrapisispora phaffii CBS 4417]|uniref:Secreted protein CSS2 C-terminal domain-containing protein n=1 Tax=Tetrapisispora phaffii (strain ATCC 24235 / CBS 4417 / NBRC 1672 / NRRL Y-8282 / UCD 70-5) TaxID=1071381 RepID=G8BZN7_TETPH|nr:hypothetical protein TPHA_0K02350 [Tetrapisispora phaffii CBS 4417]CCE65365.1 hypothetical protein TPHA_0K02350 [Tetrapisispora phaffii CBS 4417]